MKMATSLTKLMMVSAILLFSLLGNLETSAAAFANDGQETGWLNKRSQTGEWNFVGGSGSVSENSNLYGGKPIRSVWRARLLAQRQWPPSPIRGDAGHTG